MGRRPATRKGRWLELSIEAPGEYAEPLSGLFARYSDGSVAVEQAGGFNPDEGEAPPGPNASVVVRAWLPVDATTDDRLARIDLGVRLISHLRELPPLRTREVIEAEWRNQTFEPVRVGQRLLIAPAEVAEDKSGQVRPDDVIVLLEPGLAFGTGHHPTTRLCLEALERQVTGGELVVDIGCGSGILTIASLKLGARRAVCLDIDPDAIRATRRNLRRAAVGRRARVLQGTVPHTEAPEGRFDLVLANISARILIEQAAPMMACLEPGGTFIGAGYLSDRQDEVHRALQSAGAVIRETFVLSDWVAVVAGTSPG